MIFIIFLFSKINYENIYILYYHLKKKLFFCQLDYYMYYLQLLFHNFLLIFFIKNIYLIPNNILS